MCHASMEISKRETQSVQDEFATSFLHAQDFWQVFSTVGKWHVRRNFLDCVKREVTY